MDGLAIPWSLLPAELIEQHRLSHRMHERGGEREIRFLRRSKLPLLPVWCDGQYRVVPWGCRSGLLPKSGLTWLTTVESGEWVNYCADAVTVPAVLGLQNGIWYRIREGVQGLIVERRELTAAT
ncbi:hypothetical protein [Anatilimnocola floriformis]|uniref:hypothetical protein n=1 Tax=Anatilimnocola floriformis TaxID=2948575 RepID=UPI0020C2B764|nr:hypothetical protein [Anatilimnocola floriformis]